MNNENWSTWREAVEASIVDYFVQNLSIIEFKQENIISEYSEQLQGWRSVSSPLRASVNPELRALMKDDQIEELGDGRYKLVENERLYLRVQLERCRKLLQ